MARERAEGNVSRRPALLRHDSTDENTDKNADNKHGDSLGEAGWKDRAGEDVAETFPVGMSDESIV